MDGFKISIIQSGILDGPPEVFHQNIVLPPASSVHGYPDAFLLQHSGKCKACVLTPLIRIEDLGFAVPHHRISDDIHTEIYIHRI